MDWTGSFDRPYRAEKRPVTGKASQNVGKSTVTGGLRLNARNRETRIGC